MIHPAIETMLQAYSFESIEDRENALKEIIQQIALLGLYRGGFFDKAAFYGGTALRVLYGLQRFSEDLDFTLFEKNKNFKLEPYFDFISRELNAFGFEATLETIDKIQKSDVESAFMKANTKLHLLKVESMKAFAGQVSDNKKMQIKFEIDIDPVTSFKSESKYILQPISFQIESLKLPDLFAGKMHALLYRKWKTRIKGRDFYDFVWYVSRNTPLRLEYLHDKAIQSQHISTTELISLDNLKEKLYAKIETIDFEAAKKDVLPFVKNSRELDIWSPSFFESLVERLILTN
jgi:predicted nucleotidyltransferase component of viral defense system